jgi:hypothetical protein
MNTFRDFNLFFVFLFFLFFNSRFGNIYYFLLRLIAFKFFHSRLSFSL